MASKNVEKLLYAWLSWKLGESSIRDQLLIWNEMPESERDEFYVEKVNWEKKGYK